MTSGARATQLRGVFLDDLRTDAVAIIDVNVFAVIPAQRTHRLQERVDAPLGFRIAIGEIHQHADPPHLRGLLRARGARHARQPRRRQGRGIHAASCVLSLSGLLLRYHISGQQIVPSVTPRKGAAKYDNSSHSWTLRPSGPGARFRRRGRARQARRPARRPWPCWRHRDWRPIRRADRPAHGWR